VFQIHQIRVERFAAAKGKIIDTLIAGGGWDLCGIRFTRRHIVSGRVGTAR
jgi:hypothetical protein